MKTHLQVIIHADLQVTQYFSHSLEFPILKNDLHSLFIIMFFPLGNVEIHIIFPQCVYQETEFILHMGHSIFPATDSLDLYVIRKFYNNMFTLSFLK